MLHEFLLVQSQKEILALPVNQIETKDRVRLSIQKYKYIPILIIGQILKVLLLIHYFTQSLKLQVA